MTNYTFNLVEYLFYWPYSILTKCHIQGHFLSLNVIFKQKHIDFGFDGHFGTFNYNMVLFWPHLFLILFLRVCIICLARLPPPTLPRKPFILPVQINYLKLKCKTLRTDKHNCDKTWFYMIGSSFLN